MICAKKHIVILEIVHFEEDNIETTTTKMIIHEHHIAILNIYVSPCVALTNILVVLAKALCNIPLNEKIVIVRDFNVDMLQRNNKTKSLNDYMSNYNLHFFVNKKYKHQHQSLIMYGQT